MQITRSQFVSMLEWLKTDQSVEQPNPMGSVAKNEAIDVTIGVVLEQYSPKDPVEVDPKPIQRKR